MQDYLLCSAGALTLVQRLLSRQQNDRLRVGIVLRHHAGCERQELRRRVEHTMYHSRRRLRPDSPITRYPGDDAVGKHRHGSGIAMRDQHAALRIISRFYARTLENRNRRNHHRIALHERRRGRVEGDILIAIHHADPLAVYSRIAAARWRDVSAFLMNTVSCIRWRDTLIKLIYPDSDLGPRFQRRPV